MHSAPDRRIATDGQQRRFAGESFRALDKIIVIKELHDLHKFSPV
jgi:hypothetical protein